MAVASASVVLENYPLMSESTNGKSCEARAPKWLAPNVFVTDQLTSKRGEKQ